MGVVVILASLSRYLHLIKLVDRGDIVRKPSRLAIASAGLLALLGIVVCVYLMITAG